MNKSLITLAVLSTLSANVFAEEEKPTWEIAAGLGVSLTTGNTETTSVNANLHVNQYLESWDMLYKFDTIKQKSDGESSADNRLYSAKGQYRLEDEHSFLFAEGKRIEDKFGPYAENNTIAVGYGQRFYETETLTMDADIGPGYTSYERNETGEDGNSSILHMAAGLKWLISDSATFTQSVIVDKQLSDDKNALTILHSSLSTRINGSLKMSLDFKVTNNSKVQADKENTDTITSVKLVYSF